MAFSVIDHICENPGDNGGSTSSRNTTGANLIVIALSWYNAVTANPTVSDSKSNTWTPLTQVDSSFLSVQMWYAVSPTVGAGHTFTCTGSGFSPTLSVVSVSGVNTGDALDQESAGGASAGSGTTVQPGSVTPDEANCLIVSVLASYANVINQPTINGGYTALTLASQDSDHVGGGSAYLIQTSAAATNPTWDKVASSGGDILATISAVFHAASVAGGNIQQLASVIMRQSQQMLGAGVLRMSREQRRRRRHFLHDIQARAGRC